MSMEDTQDDTNGPGQFPTPANTSQEDAPVAVQEQGGDDAGGVAGDPGNDMRSPGGHLSDSWNSLKDDVGKVGQHIANSPVGQGAQTIMRYLAGADADPHLTQQAEQHASQQLEQHGSEYGVGSPDGQPQGPSQSDVHLIALHTAAEHGGEEAAYKVQQTYRSTYNAAMGHAHVALTGVPGKPADLAAAADSATKAASYVLDGTDTSFAPNADGTGFTATVKYAGGKTPQQIPLTIPQFNQLTDIGDVHGGQYDAIHENADTLTKIARGPGKPIQAPQGAQGGNQPAPGQGMTPNNAGVNRAMPNLTPSPANPTPQPGQQGQQGGGPSAASTRMLQQWRQDNPGMPDPDPGSGAASVIARGESARGNRPAQKNNNADTSWMTPGEIKYGNRQGVGADPGAPYKYASDKGVDPQLAARSHALFPSVGQEQQRLQYIDKMTQQGVTNKQAQDKIDAPYGRAEAANQSKERIAAASNTSKENVAGTKAAAYTDHANIVAASRNHDSAMKMASDIYKAGMQSADRTYQAQGQILAKKISAAATTGDQLTPDDVAQISAFSKRSTIGPQAPDPNQGQQPMPQRQQPNAPAAPAAPSAPQPGEKIVNGVRYRRGPNGEAIRVN